MTGPMAGASQGVLEKRPWLHSLLLVAGIICAYLSLGEFLTLNNVICIDGIYGVPSSCEALIVAGEVSSVPWLLVAGAASVVALWAALIAPITNVEALRRRHGSSEMYRRWWSRRYAEVAVLAAIVLLFAAITGAEASACLEPCTSPGWGQVFLYSLLLYPFVAAFGGERLCARERWKFEEAKRALRAEPRDPEQIAVRSPDAVQGGLLGR